MAIFYSLSHYQLSHCYSVTLSMLLCLHCIKRNNLLIFLVPKSYLQRWNTKKAPIQRTIPCWYHSIGLFQIKLTELEFMWHRLFHGCPLVLIILKKSKYSNVQTSALLVMSFLVQLMHWFHKLSILLYEDEWLICNMIRKGCRN